MQDTGRPYTEEGEIRTFTQDIDQSELVWHRDREDRVIDPIRPTDWMIQFDNQLPRKITRQLFIPKGVYHRTIKGTGELKIRIKKL